MTDTIATWKLAVIAFLAMCAEDVVSTFMVVQEAHYNALAAAGADMAGWFLSLICSALAIESIVKNGWRNSRSLILIAVITAANGIGTLAGVWLSQAASH